MRYPKFLKEGGTIGFVAPSFGCNIEPYRTAFEHAQKKFREAGYRMALGPNCYEGSGIGISNTPRLCGEELNEYYCSGENDVLISCGGGELMCEDLDYVDFARLREAEPKWYMGFSDNTNMTFLLPTLCDVAAVYGPCASAFGMEPWHPAVGDALELLKGRKLTMNGYDGWEKESGKDEAHPLAPYRITEPRVLRCFAGSAPDAAEGGEAGTERKRAGETDGGENAKQDRTALELTDHAEMEGILLGGCMDCLVTLLGTCYDRVEAFNARYGGEGIIWFLESCDLNVMAIRRAIWQMEHAGWFRKAKGFLIGRPLCFGQELMGMDQYEAVCGPLRKYGVPIVMDVDLGHLPPMMPLICGSRAKVTVRGNDISVRMRTENEGAGAEALREGK